MVWYTIIGSGDTCPPPHDYEIVGLLVVSLDCGKGCTIETSGKMLSLGWSMRQGARPDDPSELLW